MAANTRCATPLAGRLRGAARSVLAPALAMAVALLATVSGGCSVKERQAAVWPVGHSLRPLGVVPIASISGLGGLGTQPAFPPTTIRPATLAEKYSGAELYPGRMAVLRSGVYPVGFLTSRPRGVEARQRVANACVRFGRFSTSRGAQAYVIKTSDSVPSDCRQHWPDDEATSAACAGPPLRIVSCQGEDRPSATARSLPEYIHAAPDRQRSGRILAYDRFLLVESERHLTVFGSDGVPLYTVFPAFSPSWDVGGQYLYYFSYTEYGLWRRPLDGSCAARLVVQSAPRPTMGSPDAREAYAITTGNDDTVAVFTRRELYLFSIAESESPNVREEAPELPSDGQETHR